MKPLIETIGIFGAGLIGSSIALAAKKYRIANNIVGYDNDKKNCASAAALGVFNKISDELKILAPADIVFICTPSATIVECAKKIAAQMKKNSIITDVGSVKAGMYKSITPVLPENVCFIPGHPVAGTENSGASAGLQDMFQNRYTILITHPDIPAKSMQLLTEFWQRCGSWVKNMDEETHDMTLSVTSHLPHLIAYNMVYTACNIEKLHKSEVIRYSASGFRDFTRIAASNPIMWRDIFLMNKKNVLDSLEYFEYGISLLREAIENENGKKLYEIFESTKEVKDKVIDSKQYLDK